MTIVNVNTSSPYQVEIGHGLLSTLGEKVSALGGGSQVCIVSETNVWPLYGPTAEGSLQQAGFEPCHYVFPAGEAQKCGKTYLDLLGFLAEHHLTRGDMIVALGGGVVGDLAGFAAATYLRGIRFVQVPTTLLAAVDSSVGGKTAIDLPQGKNLAGAFYQPSLVLCDLDCLSSLPMEVFREGCAEVIKTAILFDHPMYLTLARDGLDFDREAIIAQCVRHKRDIVNADEFDRGVRQKLNLGHTIGHSVEAHSNFTLSHGASVAIGTAMVARAAANAGLCDYGVSAQIQWLLRRFGLPTSTNVSPRELAQIALSDKKRSADHITLVIPQAIGCCNLYPMAVEDLEAFLQGGY